MAYDGTLLFDTKIDPSGFTKGLGKLGKTAKKSFGAVTGAISVAGTALAGLAGAAIKAGISFESAFAGVKKTVDGTEQELASLREGILGLAREMPMTADEIAGIAESAGQLGIEKENLLAFTKTMADLGVATNLAGEEAASTLAKLANITGMDQSNFDRLGSTIVDLGNNLATTEADIAAMALRLAGTGKQIGLSEAQILSFAGALSSVGIEAEAGGTAFSKVFKDMQLAVETGNADLKNFATVAGMSAAEFKNRFQTDAAGAILAFIDGLGKSEERGMSVVKVLDELGITEVRMSDALSRASGASKVFSNALALGSKAWEDNVALTLEAEQRYSTMESRIAILRNKVTELGITFYESTNADIGGAINLLSEYVGELQTAFEADGLTGVVDALGDMVGDLAVKLAEAAPDILNAGAELIEALVDSLLDNAEAVGEAASEIAVLLLETIEKFIPKIVELAGEILKGFAKGLGDALPILKPFTAALQLIGNNLKALTTITIAYIAANKIAQVFKAVNTSANSAVKAIAAKTAANAALQAAETRGITISALKLKYDYMEVANLSTAQIATSLLTGKTTMLTAAKALCTKAQLALNAAWKANPVGLVITAVAILAAGIAILSHACNKETEEQKALRVEMEADIETMQENSEAIRESADAYEARAASIREGAEADIALLSRTEELAKELSTLADKNGEVSNSERARAEVILGELNSALGTEYTMTGNVIDQYDSLIAKIYETIQAKKAQIVADSYLEEYKAALKEQTAAEAEATENAQLLAENRKKIADAAKEAREAIAAARSAEVAASKTDEEALEYAINNNLYLSDSARVVADGYDEMVAEMETAQKSVEEYSALCQKTAEAESKYSTASMEIQLGNYDAVVAGHGRSADEMLALAQGSGQDRITEIIETCAEIQDAEENMQNAATDAEKEMWQKKIDDARAYGQALVGAYEKNGADAAEGVAKNLQGMGEEGGKQMAEAIVASLNGTPLDLSPLTEGLKASAAAQQKDLSALGDDFAAGYAMGICSEGAKINVQNAMYTLVQAALDSGQEAQDSNSPSKEAAALGKDFADGYVQGIQEGTPKVEKASGNLAEEGLASIQETQDSNSPSRATEALGDDFVAGYVNAIANGKSDAEKAAEEMGSSAMAALSRYVPEGMSYSTKKNSWKVTDATKQLFEDLERQYEFGVLAEKEYYAKLEQLRDAHLEKGTKEWWSYTKELIQNEKSRIQKETALAKTAAKDKLDLGVISETEYYLELAKIRDAYFEKGSEEWLSYTKEIALYQKELCEEQKKEIVSLFTTAAEEAGKSVDEVLKLQESMEKKLQDFSGAPFDTITLTGLGEDRDETMVYNKLHDYTKDNQKLSEYRDAIKAVKERGVPEGFMDVLRDMSVEDGTAYAKLLTEASDAEFEAHVAEWQENRDLSKGISKELYEDEAKTAAGILTAALESAGKQVPEGFFDTGKTAAENFGNGFCATVNTVVEKIKSAFSTQMQGFMPQLSYAGGVPAFGNSTTNFTTTVNVEAVTPAQQALLEKGTKVMNTMGGNT